jgi:hypothetical protein
MTYVQFDQIRWALAIILVVLAVVTIGWLAWKPPKLSGWTAVVTVLWALVPPIWFFGEYYGFDHDWLPNPPSPKSEILESVKTYADYASKIWAAVLAAILFLVKKD